jgi:DNA polymerase III delta prime subunit
MEHHAYLLLGDRGEADSHIESLFASLGMNPVGNPDVFVLESDVFSVDDARELGIKAVSKAFGERKVFVIHAQKFTPEAQNALLKTLEDPVPDTHFIITAREAQMFLPTLLSRMHHVRLSGEAEESSEVKRFLKKNPKQRIDFAKKFADEKEERGAGALAEFIDALLLTLKEEGAPAETLKRVLAVRSYARDSAAMPRLIIEHLALVLT